MADRSPTGTDEPVMGASEYVVEGDRIIRLEPPNGTGYEPDVDEWLALPVGPPCPNCGGTYFGSSNCTGYLLTRHCHGDADRPSCGAMFRGDDLELTAAEVVGRFLGYRKRFWAGNWPQHSYLLKQRPNGQLLSFPVRRGSR